MISQSEASRIRAAHDANETARQEFDPKRYKRGGGYDPKEVAEIETMAGVKKPSNEELGELDFYQFMTEKPNNYFAYYDRDMKHLTTFMGARIGTIVAKSAPRLLPHRGSSFDAGQVVTVRVQGANGIDYIGTCNTRSGTYCKLKKAAKQSRAQSNPIGVTGWIYEHPYLTTIGGIFALGTLATIFGPRN